MSAALPPLIRFQPLFGNSTLPGGKVKFYLSGTNTPQSVFDSSGVDIGSTLTLDANGATEFRLGTDLVYKIDVLDSTGTISQLGWPQDKISSDTAGTVLRQNLADSTDTALGDALVAVKRALTGALPTTQHLINEARQVDPVIDFGVPNNGVTNATTSIQAMISALSTMGVSDVVFPPGTYLLQAPASETGEPRSYAAAVIWKGLKNLRVRGSKGTKFIQNSGGAGAPEFAMFRFEECENIEICNFAADGSGINIYGTGAARSSFAFICNHNLDTKADLSIPNRNLEFHHLILDNFGGGISSATRTEAGYAYPLVTKGVSIHDIQASNIAGQNHFVGLTYTENVHVFNNKAINPLNLVAQIGNVFADMSAGVVNALVENNYAVGFTGGAKAETHTGAGVGNNEDRPSQNVVFFNNTFEQIGDPITLIFPGPSGGGFYGIKLNGINHAAMKNTITARSVNISTGGLYQGLQLTSTAVTPPESIHTAWENDIRGTVLGINHDSPADTTRKYVANISNNKIRDTVTPASPVSGNDGTGIVASRNALVQGNHLYRTRYCAVLVQTPDETYVRDNIAYNCAAVNIATISAKAVFSQAGSGAQGYFEFTNNTILDDRGVSAAEYGYFFEGGTTYTNKLGFVPGRCTTLKTAIAYDKYFNSIGQSMQPAGTLTPAPRTFVTTNSPAVIAPWNNMPWNVGDHAVLVPPAVGSPKGWFCTVAGTPGTWVSEGNL